MINDQDVRSVLLEVIREQKPRDWRHQNMQAGSILQAAAERLGVRHNDTAQEQLLLTEWHELFRTGYMAWGLNLTNPNPPFCHPTARGGEAIEWLNRDPSNPAGYLAHLHEMAQLNAVAESYINEALACYGAGAYKAAAVMIGAAAESLVVELRDRVVERLERVGTKRDSNLDDWRIKVIMRGLQAFLDGEKRCFERSLAEEYEAYWPAFAQQIRAVRNEAGHPSSIDPITPDAVRASFLVFPEIARLAFRLKEFVESA